MPRRKPFDLLVLEPRQVPATFAVFPGSPVSVGVSPGGVTTGDFDGDGDIDLATANFGSNTASVLLNNGSGTFTNAPGGPFVIGSNPVDIVAADLDGDGDLDLAATNYISDNVSILLNDGSGSFTAGTPVPVTNGPREVVAADLDGDGDTDLAVTNYSGGNVSVLLNNGAATFTTSSVPVGNIPRGLAAADLDGDGDTDLISANYGPDTVSVLLNNGAGTFTTSSLPVGTNPVSVTAADLDGDGDRDIAVSNNSNNNVSILLNNGAGAFTASTPVATGAGPRGIVSADLDGDGDIDLVVDNFSAHTMSVLLNDGTGAFTAGTPLTTANNPYTVAAADVNGDGQLDLITTNSGNSSISLFRNTTAPTVTSVTPPSNGTYGIGQHLDFTVNFNANVTVTGSPFIQLTIGSTTVNAVYVSGSGTSSLIFRYVVASGNLDADGIATASTITLNGGTIRDAALHNAAVSFTAPNTSGVLVDGVAPTSTMTSPTPATTNASSIPVTVTFSEDVTGFDVTDLVLTNATVSNFVAVNGRTYTFTLTPTINGAVSVGVVEYAGVTDAAGNDAALPAALHRVSDRTAPTTSIALASGQNAVTGQTTVRFKVTFSEAVTGFSASDVIPGGTAEGGQVSVTGSGGSYVVTISGLTRGGTVNIQVASAAGSDTAGNLSTGSGVSSDVRYSPVPAGLTTSPVGDGTNGTEIQIRDPETGTVTTTIDPFPGFRGSVDTASADVNGDGVAEVVVGAGAGGGPHVKVFDGTTGAELQSFYAFYEGFNGGVDLATGDVNGDGVMDLIVAAGAGGGPHVKVFDGRTLALLQSFYAYAPTFAGGVSVATGDLNGDGRAEIITGAGVGGSPHVKVFDGTTGAELQSFYAYAPTFTGGVNVAVGDLNGDGVAEIITGAGPGGGPHVKAFNGRTLEEVHSFFAYYDGFTGGVDVAIRDVNSDGLADIVTGAGAGGGPHVKAFDGRTLTELRSFYATDADFLGGVFVG